MNATPYTEVSLGLNAANVALTEALAALNVALGALRKAKGLGVEEAATASAVTLKASASIGAALAHIAPLGNGVMIVPTASLS